MRIAAVGRNETGQLESGTLLAGRYAVERFLAGGGMGRVYLAHDRRLSNRRCAIKEIFDRFNDPDERARAIEYFHREADTLSQLKHQSIPSIFDSFGEGNCHYLVMDYVEGTNLEDELAAQGGVLPESRVVEIARELCDVLSYLHGFRPPIIYRDMKPGNVILTPAGRVVLIDFGIARIFTPQGKATLIGTPGFAPPEQYTGQVDERSDLYGLAATLHYLLTGRDPEKHPPFSFPPVHDLKPDASPFLARAIDKALAYKPDDRHASVTAFKEMLLYGHGVEVMPEPSFGAKSATRPLGPLDAPFTTSLGEPAPSTPPPPVRGKWKRRLTALVLITAMLGSGYLLASHPQWLDVNEWMRMGERIPWTTLEAWLPESGKVWLRGFVADLPWEKEKRLQALRDNPAELLSLKVFNSTRDGTPLAEQKGTYRESEVQYLTWEAVLKNRLAGVESHSFRVEGQFIDPEGQVAGKSEVGRFARPEDTELSLRGVTLLDGLKERAKGNYQLNVYLGEKKLGSQTVRIEAEPKKVAATPPPTVATPREPTSTATDGGGGVVATDVKASPVLGPSPAEIAAAEERKRIAAEEKRQARLLAARTKPLDLVSIRFLNTDKDGHLLQPSTSDVFDLSRVRFIAWEVVFRNNLFTLEPAYHRLEGTYRGPKGQIIGTVEDGKEVAQQSKQSSFTARLGNSAGGAFEPGVHRVDFYLDGHPLLSKEFVIRDDHEQAAALPSSGVSSTSLPTNQSNTANEIARVFIGDMFGLVPDREVSLEIALQQQGDGRISGKLTIREPGYGAGLLEGRVNGQRIEFHSAIGRETYHFEGWREGDRLTGTFRSLTSGETGRWSVKASGGPAS
jgi:hypothetical protein